MTYYIKRSESGYITDIITYPYGDYEPIEYDKPLPPGSYAGWFTFEDGEFIEDAGKKEEMTKGSESIEEYRNYYNAMQEVIDE